MPRLISQAEFSRIAGVTEAAITKACKNQLAPARDGRRIDLDHPAARKYLKSKGVTPPKPTPAPKIDERRDVAAAPRAPAPTSDPAAKRGVQVIEHVVDDVSVIADMTIREVVRKFGSSTKFDDWLASLKRIEDIREKRIRNEEAEGRLIPREPVKTHVFGAIDAVNRRLLGDASKTIARRVYAHAKSGQPLEDAERIVRDLIGETLDKVKTQAARVLRNA
jgi:hypothetical protein